MFPEFLVCKMYSSKILENLLQFKRKSGRFKIFQLQVHSHLQESLSASRCCKSWHQGLITKTPVQQTMSRWQLLNPQGTMNSSLFEDPEMMAEMKESPYIIIGECKIWTYSHCHCIANPRTPIFQAITRILLHCLILP